MNYQPFLDMHILVSDELLKSIHPIFNVFLILFLIFFCVTLHFYLKNKERKERY